MITMVPKCLIILLLIFLGVESIGFGFFDSDPKWETLAITFGFPILTNPAPFDTMPLTETDAKNSGFEKFNEGEDCKGKFLGSRYWKSEDRGAILIYDVNGYLAGIQIAFSKKLVQPNVTEVFERQTMFVEDEVNGDPSYFLTAYLVKPDIICSTGRTQEQFEAEKGGTGLYIQNGTDPLKDYFEVPMKESDVLKSDPLWTPGKCFPGMGMHYWYNLTKDMDCRDFRPLFLLYTHHKLTGFGLDGLGGFPSSRFENPPELSVPLFMKEVPDCLHAAYKNLKKLTTMHVFLNMQITNRICLN